MRVYELKIVAEVYYIINNIPFYMYQSIVTLVSITNLVAMETWLAHSLKSTVM